MRRTLKPRPHAARSPCPYLGCNSLRAPTSSVSASATTTSGTTISASRARGSAVLGRSPSMTVRAAVDSVRGSRPGVAPATVVVLTRRATSLHINSCAPAGPTIRIHRRGVTRVRRTSTHYHPDMATFRVLATLTLGIMIACGTSTPASFDGGGVDAPPPDAASLCGSKPELPWWQPSPAISGGIECVSYCNDDRSSQYQCVSGKWTCGAGQIPITDCPCGGGLGLQPTVPCFACDGGSTYSMCDVAKHEVLCPVGTRESPCDAGTKD